MDTNYLWGLLNNNFDKIKCQNSGGIVDGF